MCGLIGFTSSPSVNNIVTARAMSASITHRGPDSEGIWWDESAPVLLGHRRLSILDLSPAGHQPMVSECERYVIAFNGEIYNHLALRVQLGVEKKAPVWRGHSDTETLLACFSAWGIEATLRATVGMFGIALWDQQEQVLTLARDRMGEKPLYWGWSNEVLLFGSELKALKAHPAFDPKVDRNALTLLLRHGYIPAPYSIYKGIEKLRPGCYVRIPLQVDVAKSKCARVESYWQLKQVVEEGLANPFTGGAEAAVDLMESRLLASIGDQMFSDVPLGAFLSGGIDSSTVVALMQAQDKQPVRTFTIGFDQAGYNEATHAKAVAQHLGTDHTELYVQAEDALAVIPKLPAMFCEPFGDSSQIPTFLVSQIAREQVTVALSGDGGDELFGGYNRYLAARNVWGAFQRLPLFARHAGAGLLRSLSPATWDKLFEWSRPILPLRLHLSIPGEKARKLADVLALSNEHEFYRQLTSHWTDPASVVIGAAEPDTLISTPLAWPETDCLEHSMMAVDAQTYLSDDILTKVDRAAMSTSLETRVPMLDHRVFELAWRMPIGFKIHEGQSKWLLRQILYKYVPKDLIERPKMGFGIPLDSWLRGPLREWAEALLDESRLRSEGYFHPEKIRAVWTEHLSGKLNWQHHLWNVLMFQAWLEQEDL